ncbi:ribosome silencing factor [Argonema antarcticum]|uniref:ribosome silencing factor n=1 Tax=Argonema antarcticum TaxID=2942763 RepID=UPI002013256A|nr:ribosome silencing factor [Argonema antarcticum]MCL1473942.1 ribosome silencing factor [Argonema antarcticum A004/B2]
MPDHIKTVDSAYPTILTNPSAANPAGAREDASRELAFKMVEAASDRKGGDIVLLRVSEVSYLADYFAIVTGFSRVQVRALSQGIQEKVERELQRLPLRIEGQAEGSWVLLDYGDAIAHILIPSQREFYNLDAFWGHAERIDTQTQT